jgi:hypothetical protein
VRVYWWPFSPHSGRKINTRKGKQKCMPNYNVGWVGGHMNYRNTQRMLNIKKHMKYGGMNGGVINPNGRNSMIFTNMIPSGRRA